MVTATKAERESELSAILCGLWRDHARAVAWLARIYRVEAMQEVGDHAQGAAGFGKAQWCANLVALRSEREAIMTTNPATEHRTGNRLIQARRLFRGEASFWRWIAARAPIQRPCYEWMMKEAQKQKDT